MKVAVKNISNNITQDEMDAGRLQSVFDITVEDGSKVTLPESFTQSVRVDLVPVSYTHLTLPTTSRV